MKGQSSMLAMQQSSCFQVWSSIGTYSHLATLFFYNCTSNVMCRMSSTVCSIVKIHLIHNSYIFWIPNISIKDIVWMWLMYVDVVELSKISSWILWFFCPAGNISGTIVLWTFLCGIWLDLFYCGNAIILDCLFVKKSSFRFIMWNGRDNTLLIFHGIFSLFKSLFG